MESVLESHGPCESLELSIVQIGLETAELRVDTVVGGRRFGPSSTGQRFRIPLGF